MRATARWGVLAAALLLFLFVGDVPARTIFWDALFDAGHVPLFGLLALAVLRLIRARHPAMRPRGLWSAAFLVTLVIGAATELIQFFQPNREPSFDDLARDAAGASAFLLVAAAFPRLAGGPSPLAASRGRGVALVTAGVLMMVGGAALATAVAVLVERDRAMPTVMAFDGSWWERRLVEEDGSRLTPGVRPSGLPADFREPLARLDLRPGTYPGIAINEPHPDWRGYHRLTFTIVSDLEAPTRLTIRVHDAAHDQRIQDRFNRGLTIAPGINRISIPLDDIRYAPDRREMDMSRIRGIIIFGYRLAAPVHLFVGPLGLE